MKILLSETVVFMIVYIVVIIAVLLAEVIAVQHIVVLYNFHYIKYVVNKLLITLLAYVVNKL